jgi:hypothetical protein
MATNMMASMKNTVASCLLIEDHLAKNLAKSGTVKFHDPKNSKLVPRQKHSCFGDFPKDHLKPQFAIQEMQAPKQATIGAGDMGALSI